MLMEIIQELKLTLHGYLTPSLNVMLNKHWSHYHKLKKEAKAALTSALQDIVADPLTATTTLEVVNRLLTNYDTPSLSATITQKQSKSSSSKLKSRIRIRSARK